MERRTVLLGSGAALVTALAGCTGSGDDPDNSSETGQESTDDDKYDDVPGLEPGDVSVDSDYVSIDAVKRDGETVKIEATTETTDREKLRQELTYVGGDLEKAAYDFEEFSDRIGVIEWSLYDGDRKVLSFYVDVEWIREYVEGELSEDELADEVTGTIE